MEELIFRLATDTDIDAINAFYNSVYKKNRTHRKFNWEYNSAPAGKAIYVVAEHNGRIVGTQCVIPYFLITHANEVILSGKSEDTLVSPDYRGKNIFEKMYALLIAACKKNNIACIWGFTYAVKPFLKLGFSVPFQSQMGLMVLKPVEAGRYFASLSAKNTATDKLKISALCFASWAKAKLKSLAISKSLSITEGHAPLNTADHNYLNYNNSFGLKLDAAFMDYRIANNPYNQNYKTCSAVSDRGLKMQITFNVTAQNIGYILHLHVEPGASGSDLQRFLAAVIKNTELKHCAALRFWGFGHTRQNREETELLGAAGFAFINRGISFVWLPLAPDLKLSAADFVLSRMASQGTD